MASAMPAKPSALSFMDVSAVLSLLVLLLGRTTGDLVEKSDTAEHFTTAGTNPIAATKPHVPCAAAIALWYYYS